MKKLSILFAMVFALTFAMAQNTATTTQTGEDNTATTTQSGDLNTATVDQTGNTNFVNILSQGNSNTAVASQNGNENGDASKPNLGYIKQIGSSNQAYLTEGLVGQSTSNLADGFIDQSGDGNYAELNISGDYHNFTEHGITQINTGEGPGNSAVITEAYYGNDMDVYQSGSGNRVTGEVNGSYSQFFVDQVGTGNTGSVYIEGNNNGEPSWWTKSSSLRALNVLSQEGTDNDAEINQQGDFNTFVVTQEGVDNYAYSNQIGNGNATTIVQQGSAVDYNHAEVEQYGDDNTAGVAQSADNNTAYIYQGWGLAPLWDSKDVVGSSNTASIAQSGGEFNFAGIWSLGDENDVTVSQNGNDNVARLSNGYNYATVNGVPELFPASGNAITLTQGGDDNWVRNFQLGDDNTLTISQLNGGNTVGGRTPRGETLEDGRNARAEYFQQLGDGNTLVGTQNGDATLDAASIQAGDENEILLTQGSGDWALIIQQGDMNDATVTQYSGGQHATVDQLGNSNIASITQGN